MQKFNYTPTNPFSGSLSSLAIGAGMVIVPLVYPFGIRIGRMPILGAPPRRSSSLSAGSHCWHSPHARSCRRAGSSLRAGKSRRRRPGHDSRGEKGTVTNESFRLPDVEYTKFDAEENEFTISLPAAHHVIRGAFFESSDAFDAFKSTFK